MKHIKTQNQYCPAGCGYRTDSVTGAFGDYSPDEGDFSICMNCYAILRFGKKWKLQLSSLEESEEFGVKEDLQKAIAAAKQVRVQRALGFEESN
ncbi:MAG: hypothetical protein HWQ38_09810 [Nostoc sp. NMS7]|uniref:hypothetical protein n=1 Tax=Nostoc sp. NMS7 TaxID=2815391 RepID=UPI0025CEDA74|nr:hypothetical protein [Nostoc sp. NMS7]MBN3946764.1 hypothetical protein [Nostoc sp. NMS7]